MVRRRRAACWAAKLGQDLIAKRAELVLLPKEIRLARDETFDHLVELGFSTRTEAEMLVVSVETLEPERVDPFAEAALEKKRRVVVEVEPRVLVDDVAKQAKLLGAERRLAQEGHPTHRGQ